MQKTQTGLVVQLAVDGIIGENERKSEVLSGGVFRSGVSINMKMCRTNESLLLVCFHDGVIRNIHMT